MISRVDKTSSTLEKLTVREISAENAEINNDLSVLVDRIQQYNAAAENFVASAEKVRVNTEDPEFIDKMISKADKKMDELKTAAWAAQKKADEEMRGYNDLKDILFGQDKTLNDADAEQKRSEKALEDALNEKAELLKEINTLKLTQVDRPEKMKKLIKEYNDGVKERSEFIKEIESKYSQREINESEYLHECSELADNYVKIFEGDNGPGKPPKIGYNDALTLRRVILGEISQEEAEYEGPRTRMEEWLGVFRNYIQMVEATGERKAGEDSPEEEIAYMLDQHAKMLDTYQYSDLKYKYSEPDVRDVMHDKFDMVSVELQYSIKKIGKELLFRFDELEELDKFKKEKTEEIEKLQEQINLPPEAEQERKLTEKLMQADEKVKFAAAHAENAKESRKKAEEAVSKTRESMRNYLAGTQRSRDELNKVTTELREYQSSKETLEGLKAKRSQLESTRKALDEDIKQFNEAQASRKIVDGRPENVNADIKDFMSRMNFHIEGHTNSTEFSQMAEALEGLRATMQGFAEHNYNKDDVITELNYVSEKAAAYRQAKGREFFKKNSAMRNDRLNFARELKEWADAMKGTFGEEITAPIDPAKKALVSKTPAEKLLPEPKASSIKIARNTGKEAEQNMAPQLEAKVKEFKAPGLV